MTGLEGLGLVCLLRNAFIADNPLSQHVANHGFVLLQISVMSSFTTSVTSGLDVLFPIRVLYCSGRSSSRQLISQRRCQFLGILSS